MWFDKYFVNLCILVACLFFLHQVLKDRRITPSSPLRMRLGLGVVHGMLGWVLMLHTIHVGSNTVFDLRMLPVFLSATVGGSASALMAAVTVGTGRVVLFDWTPATIAALSNLMVTAILCGVIVRYARDEYRRWLYMSLVNIVALGVSLQYLPGGTRMHMQVLWQYALVLLVASLFTYSLVRYLNSSHEAFVKVRESARLDFLTGLNNVRSFDAAINSLLQKTQEHGEDLALLLIDIDHFKKVNDTYGHPAGDEVLKQLSAVLTQTAGGEMVLSRNGGEEFSVILPACSQDEALRVAEQIRAAIEAHPFRLPDGQRLQMTVSTGLALSTPESPLTAYELVDLADEGLYRAKRAGRNRVCVLDSAQV